MATAHYFGAVGAKAAVRGEALAARVAHVWPVFGSLHLTLVVAEMLLKVRQLDEGPVALGEVTLVRTLAWKEKKRSHLSRFNFGEKSITINNYLYSTCLSNSKSFWTRIRP